MTSGTTASRRFDSTTAAGQLVGCTPMVELTSVARHVPHRVLGKCEFANPAGSVKDRIGKHIVERAEAEGLLVPGRSVLVEGTSGNTGMALASAAAGKYRLICTMSTKMGPEKERQLRAWGADVVRCPYEVPPESAESFLNTARRIAEEDPDAYFVDQFNNPWNVEVHERTTGPEILEQAGPDLGMVVAGVGTGGMFTGVGRYLRSQGCRAAMVMCDPEGSIIADALAGRPTVAAPYRVEGIGGDFLPPLLDPTLVDRAVTIPDRESVAMCLRLRDEEGLLVGGSSGCAVAAALRVLEDFDGPPMTVVVLLCDAGDRYVSTIYNAEWRRSVLGMVDDGEEPRP